MELQQHFEEVRKLIRQGRARALQAANTQQMAVYWRVGAYVHDRIQNSEWGEKTVEQLKEQYPALKGFDKRSAHAG
jgi:hypothetical protein